MFWMNQEGATCKRTETWNPIRPFWLSLDEDIWQSHLTGTHTVKRHENCVHWRLHPSPGRCWELERILPQDQCWENRGDGSAYHFLLCPFIRDWCLRGPRTTEQTDLGSYRQFIGYVQPKGTEGRTVNNVFWTNNHFSSEVKCKVRKAGVEK